MMKRFRFITACLIFFLLPAFLQAFDKAAYYKNADGGKAEELKTALYKIIGNPDVKSYSSLWTYYYQTDRLSDNQVIDRYSYTKRYFETQNGNAVSGMNKEHGIPQSWWGGGTSNNIGSDLQHVLPSEADANSRKSNYGMGIVTNTKWTNNCIKVGTGQAGNNGTVQLWEPADEWKGDFARIYFYIVTCYENMSLVQAEGCNTMQSNTYPKLQPWAYELYIKWSKEDPVDEQERKRNDIVFGIQGNRNPFVDFPGLERYIWGDYKSTAFDLDNYEEPEEGNTQIDATAEFEVERKSMLLGETFQQSVKTNSNGTVTYESSNADVAVVDAQSGLVTANAIGTAEITAYVAASSTYRSARASYTVVVTSDGGEPGLADGNTYVKVTERLANWAGTYLIVYESESVAMNGGLETFDQVSNTIPVDIYQQTINVSAETEAAEFVITAMTDGKYSVRGRNGKYVGHTTSKNNVDTSDKPLANTLSVTDGEAIILADDGYSLRFNNQSGQKRFRYYKTGQMPICLYRRTEAGDAVLPVWQQDKVGKDAVIYDLAGRRIGRICRPGMYLINGKKVIIK